MNNQDKKLAKQLPYNHGFAPLWRLRWRFEYHDGKADRVGVWNGNSPHATDMAAYVDKTNLVWAHIEGEKVGSWSLRKLFSISGQDYMHCMWNAAASGPMFFPKTYDKYTPRTNIIGLTMLSRHYAYTVTVDNQFFKRDLTDKEKNINLTEHKLGGGNHAN